MKKMILIISILSLLIMGCSEDDAPTTPTTPATDYTEFLDELEQEIPPCYHDCVITSPTSMCTLALDDPAPTCMADCTADDAIPQDIIDTCVDCLAADNCDEVMLDDDDDDYSGIWTMIDFGEGLICDEIVWENQESTCQEAITLNTDGTAILSFCEVDACCENSNYTSQEDCEAAYYGWNCCETDADCVGEGVACNDDNHCEFGTTWEISGTTITIHFQKGDISGIINDNEIILSLFEEAYCDDHLDGDEHNLTQENCEIGGYPWQEAECEGTKLTPGSPDCSNCEPECVEHSDCDSNYCKDEECIPCPYEYDCNGECGGGAIDCDDDDGDGDSDGE